MKNDDENTRNETKRTLKSFREASLNLAKLHVSNISSDEFICNNNMNHLTLVMLHNCKWNFTSPKKKLYKILRMFGCAWRQCIMHD